MADSRQVKLLREKGAQDWNIWRKRTPEVRPDLSGAVLKSLHLEFADLSGADLDGIDLSLTNLSEANLRGANLHRANLSEGILVAADLAETNLTGANLAGANFYHANLNKADLRWANLNIADLSGANLRWANLCEATLRRTNLFGTDLTQARVTGADLSNAFMIETQLGNLDLSSCKGLELVEHFGPSTIGIDTIIRSSGNIPDSFLRGAGVPEVLLSQMKSVLNSRASIEFYSCFLSYSAKDRHFAQRLYADLQSRGVRCWYAPEDLKTGDRFRQSIDEAIRVYDKLLVVLSRNSIQSPWVEEEVEGAMEKERQKKKLVLFPVRLDKSVMETDLAWAAALRRTRHIGDFTRWKDHDFYQKALQRLLRDLAGTKTKRN